MKAFAVICIFYLGKLGFAQKPPTPWMHYFNPLQRQPAVPFGSGPCLGVPTKSACPLLGSGSTLFPLPIMQKVVAHHPEWFALYTYVIYTNATNDLAKCRYSFTPEGKNVYSWEAVCFSRSIKQCNTFSKKVVLMTDKCGRVRQEPLIGPPLGPPPEEFVLYYSQEPWSYLWMDVCAQPEVDGSCGQRIVHLQLPAFRIQNKLRIPVLTGLPWDKISADLYAVMKRHISDPVVKHEWMGPECPLQYLKYRMHRMG